MNVLGLIMSSPPSEVYNCTVSLSPKMIHETGPASFIFYLVNQNTSYNPSNMFRNMNSIDKNREKLKIGQFFGPFLTVKFFSSHKGIKQHYPKFFFFSFLQWDII